MTAVGSYEAKTHLPKLLDRAHRGERIVIAKHGVPYAVLAPADDASEASIADAVAAMQGLKGGLRLDGLTVRELVEEGRRY